MSTRSSTISQPLPLSCSASRALQQLDLGAALHAVVGRAADRVDQAQVELAGDDGGRHQPAAGDRDQALERPEIGQPPCQRPGVAVQFRPRDGKHLVVAGTARHAIFSLGLSGLACPPAEAALTASTDAMKIDGAGIIGTEIARIMGFELTPAFWSGLTQIILVNIVLSGDNALVIALACRNLEKRHQKPAILVGSAGAIVLRIIFVLIVDQLLQISLPEADRRPAAAVDRRQAGAGRGRARRRRQGGGLAVGRHPHHHHRRRGDEPRQCHRHRRRGQGRHDADHPRPADQHPADHLRRHPDHDAAAALPDHRRRRRRPARLDRGRSAGDRSGLRRATRGR